MNFQLYNNSLEDWSLGKRLILFPSNLNVFLGRQNLKLHVSPRFSNEVFMIAWKYIWSCWIRFNAQQCSVTYVGCYTCLLDNSTLCNFMLHVCRIFCAWLIWLFCFVAIMPYFKLHTFNFEFQSLLSMPTIKEMEVSNIKLSLRWSKEIVCVQCFVWRMWSDIR